MKRKLIFIGVLSVATLHFLFLPFFLRSQILMRAPAPSRLQYNQAYFGESASGQLTINKGTRNSKTSAGIRELKANQIGVFNRISDIKPRAIIPFEINYPEGQVGEKVLLSVLDGGKLDNGKGVKVVTLNNEKKVSFNFQAAGDRGLYRVSLSKGYDTKVVQIWVGPAPSPSRSLANKNINLKNSF